MSGTSMDGIDVALVDFSKDCKLVGKHFIAYPADLRSRLLQLARAKEHCQLDELGDLDHQLGLQFGETANRLLKQQEIGPDCILAIGSHGQTIRHRPASQSNGALRYTMQIGDPNVIVETTGITTVADFRRRDIAAGGQGAPLTPAFHAAIFSSNSVPRVIINIGGIANITILDNTDTVWGFDTGPGNCLMDQWCRHKFQQAYDAHGALASQGSISNKLLSRLLTDLYFKQDPPKSTGPEYFNLSWLNQNLQDIPLNQYDVLRTLNQFTAETIANSIKRYAATAKEIYICGGGVHNTLTMHELRLLLPGLMVEDTSALGIDPDYVEASAFAWLARQTIMGKTGNLPSVTGAGQSVILGGIYKA